MIAGPPSNSQLLSIAPATSTSRARRKNLPQPIEVSQSPNRLAEAVSGARQHVRRQRCPLPSARRGSGLGAPGRLGCVQELRSFDGESTVSARLTRSGPTVASGGRRCRASCDRPQKAPARTQPRRPAGQSASTTRRISKASGIVRPSTAGGLVPGGPSGKRFRRALARRRSRAHWASARPRARRDELPPPSSAVASSCSGGTACICICGGAGTAG